MTFRAIAALFVSVLTAAVVAQQPPVQPTPDQQPPAQPSEITTTITGGGGSGAPRLAVPDFLALSSEPETLAAAKEIAQVLYEDLRFEREFALIPRDTYVTVAAPRSMTDVPLDGWRELNADGVIVGAVQKTATGIRVEVRLIQVRSGGIAMAQLYNGDASARARGFAHHISDDLHQTQRNLRGVARTKLTFNSDRDAERLGRTGKEIYVSDYDGFGERRVTTQFQLNISSVWSHDARSLVYASWRRGQAQLFLSNVFEGTMSQLTTGPGENVLPAMSPDGTRVAFASTRDGAHEIYVMNLDGSNLIRLTNHPMNDTTPTWSPSGQQIAFTSDRGGSPQIYIVSADGLGQPQKLTSESYADRASWAPAPYNEIAYAARTGPGFDIKVINLATREVRQLTFGEGTNESPSFAPNGRHIAFTSTRAGKVQIFTIAIDGNRQSLRQITRVGNNFQPNWSR